MKVLAVHFEGAFRIKAKSSSEYKSRPDRRTVLWQYWSKMEA